MLEFATAPVRACRLKLMVCVHWTPMAFSKVDATYVSALRKSVVTSVLPCPDVFDRLPALSLYTVPSVEKSGKMVSADACVAVMMTAADRHMPKLYRIASFASVRTSHGMAGAHHLKYDLIVSDCFRLSTCAALKMEADLVAFGSGFRAQGREPRSAGREPWRAPKRETAVTRLAGAILLNTRMDGVRSRSG